MPWNATQIFRNWLLFFWTEIKTAIFKQHYCLVELKFQVRETIWLQKKGSENGNNVRPPILNLKMASFQRMSVIIRYFDRLNQLRRSGQRKSSYMQEEVLKASFLHSLLSDLSAVKEYITPLCTFEMDANLLCRTEKRFKRHVIS